ncbi:MAG: sodium:solute symporter family protein [Dehalococcoidia bacterium]|nr:sodium:solute symporter family protein [Dehalococcoidia bacterium]MDH5781170.1 sodium:solute symporter family protein [Dehalococcoidia bacterium]
MGITFWVWLAVGIYIVLGFIIAIAARRRMRAGMSEFFLANRKVGGFISAMTYSATTYSAFMMVGLAGLTYVGGVGALGFELTYLCGLFLALFFLPRFWLAGRKYGYITPMDLLSDRYQSKLVGATAAILALVFLVPYSGAQLMGIGFLMNGLSGGTIPVIVGIIVATCLAIAWSRIAGLRSIAWTDAFQALVMIVSSAAILGLVIFKLGGFCSFFSQVESTHPDLLRVPSGGGMWNINMFVGLALPWFFFCISNPQVSQRFFIPKSVKAMKQMLGGFLIFGFSYTLISVLWGFSTKLLVPGLEKADMATPMLLALPIIPKALALIVMIGIMAAAISTIDSILLTLSSVWARDIHKGLINPKVSEARELRVGQWVIPTMAIVAFVFAWQVSSKTGLEFMIATLSAASSAGLLMIVPSIFGAFYWRRSTAMGAIVSSIVGAIIVLTLQVTGYKPLGWWPGTWGILACVILFIAVSLATKPPLEKAEEFMGYLKEKLALGNFV